MNDKNKAQGGVSHRSDVRGASSRPFCPSAPCKEGAHLIGIVQEDGRVGILPQALVIDETFVEKASRGRTAEKRFRFASPCLESGCRQWNKTRCGVIDKIMETLTQSKETVTSVAPTDCGIREKCRWVQQLGETACNACPVVVTDTLDA